MTTQAPIERVLLDALAGSGHAMALYDADDRLRWASRSYEQRFLRGGVAPGAQFADVLRHGFSRGFGVKVDSGDIEAFLRAVLPRRRSAPLREFATDLVDGTWLWVTEQVLDGGWLLCTLTDITALKRTEHALARAHAEALRDARTDALTGAVARAWALQSATLALEACLQSARPISLAVLDLDEFKSINDLRGHAAGDAVLRHFVGHCRSGLRPEDALGRLGGEEFLLVMPNTGAAAAQGACDRLRETLVPVDGVAYTFSAGVAQARPGDGLAELLERADAALYQAKRAGRSRTVVAG